MHAAVWHVHCVGGTVAFLSRALGERRLEAAYTLIPVVPAYIAALAAGGLTAVVGFGTAPAVIPPFEVAVLPLVGAAALLAGLETSRRLRKARATLSHYVPRQVARRILCGDDLTPGEHDVSVLILDLRSYVQYVERRTPKEIYTLLARYSLIVSSIIHRHGGTMVEFTGDGMVALFGAPDALRDKERASVEAGCAIVDAVREMQQPGGGPQLEVGVGIATGNAFVGAIPAADRLVWSVVGNTTNLAARLQALTRELGHPIAVCEATHAKVASLGLGFTAHEKIAIRGRTDGVDVYTLSSREVARARAMRAEGSGRDLASSRSILT
jgi:class 3 adenylate cyclase